MSDVINARLTAIEARLTAMEAGASPADNDPDIVRPKFTPGFKAQLRRAYYEKGAPLYGEFGLYFSDATALHKFNRAWRRMLPLLRSPHAVARADADKLLAELGIWYEDTGEGNTRRFRVTDAMKEELLRRKEKEAEALADVAASEAFYARRRDSEAADKAAGIVRDDDDVEVW